MTTPVQPASPTASAGRKPRSRGDGPSQRRIAYFTMEVGADPRMPTYSGGLGVLAGDTLRSAADLRLPVVAVSLLYRRGYFQQKLDAEGTQTEHPEHWEPEKLMRPLPPTVAVTVFGKRILLRAWQYDMLGLTGFVVPLVLLDADFEGNPPGVRRLTESLYGGDERYRLSQEILLGIGGVRMLRALGYRNVDRFHMNEGHAGLLGLELIREEPAAHTPIDTAIVRVRSRCVFTTNTPVPAGPGRFHCNLVSA